MSLATWRLKVLAILFLKVKSILRSHCSMSRHVHIHLADVSQWWISSILLNSSQVRQARTYFWTAVGTIS
jgi:hypothetical protein